VEARLLALADVDVVAAKTGHSAAAIEAFEQLFFDFRERHDSAFWIDWQIIRSHTRFDHPQDLRTAVLRLALYGGPVVVDQVISTVSRHVSDHGWDTIARAAGNDAPAIDRQTLMALATMMAPRTVEAHAKLVRQYRKLRRDLGLFDEPQPATAGEAVPLWERLREEILAAYAAPRPQTAKLDVA
jgi:hypothetical protein